MTARFSRVDFAYFVVGLMGGAFLLPMDRTFSESSDRVIVVDSGAAASQNPEENLITVNEEVDSLPKPDNTTPNVSANLNLPPAVRGWLQLSVEEAQAIEELTAGVVAAVWRAWIDNIADQRFYDNGAYSIILGPLEHDRVSSFRGDYLAELKRIVGEERFWVLWDNTRSTLNKRCGHFGAAKRQVFLLENPIGWEWTYVDDVLGTKSDSQFCAEKLPDELSQLWESR